VTLDDPVFVRAQHATEAGLVGRRVTYRWADGPDAPQVLVGTIAASEPANARRFGAIEERDTAVFASRSGASGAASWWPWSA
jgi:hypothetical protein